jgi:hypothetical protein
LPTECATASNFTPGFEQEVVMSEKIKLDAISRRGVLSVFGLAAAASLAVPATVLTVTEAEAVVGRPATPMSAAGVARRANRRSYKKKRKKKK